MRFSCYVSRVYQGMKRKHLLAYVQQIEGFANPDIKLEQYMTPPDIACDIIICANVKDKVVVDLGCGTGVLSIAAVLLEAKRVYSVDVDKNALLMLNENISNLLEDASSITAVHSDVDHFSGINGDICVFNPPFGTRNPGVDKLFIKKGLELCPIVYSLHKSSTREHLVKYCASLNAKCTVLAEVRYNLENSYSFHKSKSKDIQVDLLEIKRN
eukprot:NODE_147_length_17537_cov_0.265627.p7 type:complete len:213 gc:universal NODE_147_length_17537_cov_0.265627:2497-1859(-)